MSAKPLFSVSRFTLFKRDFIRAYATVQVCESVFLTGIRVVEGKNGLFISMPNRKTTNGDYQDIFFPSSRAIRDELTRLLLERYDAELKKDPAFEAQSEESPAVAEAA